MHHLREVKLQLTLNLAYENCTGQVGLCIFCKMRRVRYCHCPEKRFLVSVQSENCRHFQEPNSQNPSALLAEVKPVDQKPLQLIAILIGKEFQWLFEHQDTPKTSAIAALIIPFGALLLQDPYSIGMIYGVETPNTRGCVWRGSNLTSNCAPGNGLFGPDP